ncbi:hypothetical protein DB347_04140 [Opitutaceae bacterium EW11]|nr:hypothetical protein DB347_04140 [Opitutaceae bacterium EW11]
MTTTFRSCIAVLIAGAALAGCSTIDYDQSGENYAVFQYGEFKMLVNANARRTVDATERALPKVDLRETAKRVNRFDAKVAARAWNRTRVLVTIEEVNSLQTLVTIQWGEQGHLDLSRQLFDEIDAALPSVP